MRKGLPHLPEEDSGGPPGLTAQALWAHVGGVPPAPFHGKAIRSWGQTRGEPWVKPEILVGGHPVYLKEGQRWRCRVCGESFRLGDQRGQYERELGLCGREALLQLPGPKTKRKDLCPPPHQE